MCDMKGATDIWILPDVKIKWTELWKDFTGQVDTLQLFGNTAKYVRIGRERPVETKRQRISYRPRDKPKIFKKFLHIRLQLTA
jgi:hypothetical protein